MSARRLALAALLLLSLTACASYEKNVALARADKSYGYRFSHLEPDPAADETFVILTFSGGGTRAAALAYGTLAKLASTPIRGGRTLLDEVDVISSVSGGSFTAMAYGLEHRFPMKEFESSFLYHDVQGDLARAAASPVNWPRLFSPHYSRIDLATDYYDRHIFGGHTYADLAAAPRRPFLLVNATEMDLGARFEFTQEQFDPICSDLSRMPVARAVAASSAFPILLTPVTLENDAGRCDFAEPQWVANALNDRLANPVRYQSALDARALVAPERLWLHLMDGGIADNIGLRGPMRSILSTDPELSLLRMVNLEKVKRVAIIAVNAETASGVALDRKETTPSIVDVLMTVSSAPMSNYSADTVALIQERIENWNKDQAMIDNCSAILHGICPDAKIPDEGIARVKFYRVEVSFDLLPPEERKQFDRIGTNFSLDRADVDRLIAVAGRVMGESEEYGRLVGDLK
jgi:NTE family protein